MTPNAGERELLVRLTGFTFFGCEVACGISPACSGGVVCGWGEAPRGEWGTREWRGERRSNPAWTAGPGADVSGWGCLPSARQGVNKCDEDLKKKKKKMESVQVYLK